jgi:3alpha(or 20beta)-hydroxysteroid dehydrogenase
MSRLEGRRTVITGAASGIGEETARLFVAEGATVVLADVDDERGTAIAVELGDCARYVHVDVSEEGAIEHALDESVSAFGGLDCLFNNAGNPGSIGRVEEIDMTMFDRTIGIHLRGA